MKVRVLGSFGGNTKNTNLTNFVVDDFLALDAGCLTSVLHLEEQYRITHVLISHSHMDHITSLPFLVDNLFGTRESGLQIWGGEHVIKCLKDHVFNNVIWPDFSTIPFRGKPSISFHPIESRDRFKIGALTITPIPVNHIVPTFAFYIEDATSGFLFTSDTSSTEEIWMKMNHEKKLKAIIVDCSFPNSMHDLAVTSGHMTPKLLAMDLKKLKKKCQIFVYHAKPSFETEINNELAELGLNHIKTNIQGQILEF